MQEVLFKSDNPNACLKETELFILDLYDPTPYSPEFVVMQSRTTWSEIDRAFMCDEVESDRLQTLAEAQKCYEARRLALSNRGFVHSDMEF